MVTILHELLQRLHRKADTPANMSIFIFKLLARREHVATFEMAGQSA
jgi:hypothetical protein